VERIDSRVTGFNVKRVVCSNGVATSSGQSVVSNNTTSNGTTDAKNCGYDDTDNSCSTESGSDCYWNYNVVTASNNLAGARTTTAERDRARVGWISRAGKRNENTTQDRIASIDCAEVSIIAKAGNVLVNASNGCIATIDSTVVLIVAHAWVQCQEIVTVATTSGFASNFSAHISNKSHIGTVDIGPLALSITCAAFSCACVVVIARRKSGVVAFFLVYATKRFRLAGSSSWVAHT